MCAGAEINPIAERHGRLAVQRANAWAARAGHPELAVEYDALPLNVRHLVAQLATHCYKLRGALDREHN